LRKKPIKKAFHIGVSLVLILGLISTPSLGAIGTDTGLALKADKLQQLDNNPKPSLSAQIQAMRKQTPNTPAAQIIANKTSSVNDLTSAAVSQTRKSNWKNVLVPDNKKQVKIDPTKATNSKPTSINKTTKNTTESVPNEVIVKFKQNTDAKTSRDKYSLQKVKNFSSTGGELLKTPQGVSVDTVINALKADNTVEYAQPNYKYYKSDIPNDPKFGDMWGLQNTGQSILNVPGMSGIDINAPGAWDVTKGKNTVIVADIDTGDDISHPDLKEQIWTNPGEIPGNGIDDDHNGFIDDVNGWDFYHGDKTLFDPGDINPDDNSPSDSHGTHTAGTIAAAMNNSVGVVGIAPNVKVMPVKFLGPDGGTTAMAISAIEYAASNGAKIANNSWGGGSYDQALEDAITASKMLFVAAAGNDGNNNDINPVYPASYDCSNILSVAAVDNSGNLASFSNYGANSVDVAAPGVSVLSTIPNGGYAYYSGTSMATPHVTGTAALLYSLYPDMTPEEAIQIIKNTGTPLTSLQGNVASGRLVNAANAVNAKSGTLDDDVPGVSFTDAIARDTVDATSDKDDVHNVWLNKGETLTTSLSGDSGTDFDLYLFAPNSLSVNSSDGMVGHSENPGTSTESIQYTAPTAGYYYIDVYAYSGSGAYTLTAGNIAGTYEDTHSALLFKGAWNTLSNSTYSGGTVKQLNSTGDVEFTFIGSQIEWKAFRDDTQGTANVYIDGSLIKAVPLYSAVPAPSETVFQAPLQFCKHTIKVEWAGLRDPVARKNSTNINVDSFVVSAPADTTPPSVPTLNEVYFDSSNWAPHLSWTAVPDTDVSGYNVYRAEGSSGFVLADPQPIKPQATVSYVDYNTVPGHTYQYSISSVDYSGNESAHSQPKTFVHDDDMPGLPMTGTSASGTLNQDTDKYDVWSVHLDAGQTYAFSFNGDTGTDFDYSLFPRNSTSIANSSPLRYPGEATSEEYFSYPVTTSGTYYVVTHTYSGSGAYNFNVTSKPSAYDDNIAGTPLPSGNKVSDFLDYIDKNDVYSVALKAGDTFHVSLGSQAHNSNDFDVYLFPPSARTINPANSAYIPNVAGSNILGTSTESYTYVVPSDGTYFIDVSNSKGSGPYDLSATTDSEPPVITAMNPAEGSTVGANFAVTGTATDNNVVDRVELNVLYTPISASTIKSDLLPASKVNATSTTYDFTGTIDLATLGAKEGPISVEAIAYDKAGNKSAIVTRNYIYSNPVPTGIYENDNSALKYSGTWAKLTGPYIGGSMTRSNVVGDSVSLTFSGDSIKWTAWTGYGYGTANVYIDGYLDATVNLGNTSYTDKVVYQKTGLQGDHTIKIEVASLYVTIDNITVSVNSNGAGTYQNDNNAISYSDSWATLSSPLYSGGTMKRSNVVGASVSLTFSGDSIKWTAWTGPGYGTANVYIDGHLDATVNLGNTSYTDKVVYQKTDLQGDHTIKIEVASLYVTIDNITVSVNSNGAGTYQNDNNAILYSGSWATLSSPSYSGGSMTRSNIVGDSVAFTFTGATIKLTSWTGPGYGTADIYLDDVNAGSINLYNSSYMDKIIYQKAGLSGGTHRIKVVVTSKYVTIDNLIVDN